MSVIPLTKPNRQLPRITLLALGGTIAGKSKQSTVYTGYRVAVSDITEVLSSVPELSEIADIQARQLFQVASQDMASAHLLRLGKEVNQLLSREDCDGIVITQGTNTLEETAFFLNLVVHSHKPVVITGAMRPATSLSADGPMNLFRSTVVASSELAKGRGVMVVLNDQILGARDVHKTDTMTVDSFKSPLFGVMGLVADNACHFYRSGLRRHTLDSEFDISKLEDLPKVDIVYGYQDDDRGMLDSCVASGSQGIVLAGAGTAAVSSRLLPAVKDAISKGLSIVRVSRSSLGLVGHNVEFDDDLYGTISGDTLNPAKARILLMLAMTITSDRKILQTCFDHY
jgi:L-asparaginase